MSRLIKHYSFQKMEIFKILIENIDRLRGADFVVLFILLAASTYGMWVLLSWIYKTQTEATKEALNAYKDHLSLTKDQIENLKTQNESYEKKIHQIKLIMDDSIKKVDKKGKYQKFILFNNALEFSIFSNRSLQLHIGMRLAFSLYHNLSIIILEFAEYESDEIVNKYDAVMKALINYERFLFNEHRLLQNDFDSIPKSIGESLLKTKLHFNSTMERESVVSGDNFQTVKNKMDILLNVKEIKELFESLNRKEKPNTKKRRRVEKNKKVKGLN